ncbi:MAG TPA: hypothetical protein VFT99_04895, partial [Roseiflexaceae bacterium]|nr:hypothetical protein [Roseiflexaceae bacterium]
FTKMGPRLVTYNDMGSLEHLKPKPEEAKADEQPAGDAKPAGAEVQPALPAEQAGVATEQPEQDGGSTEQPVVAPSANGVEHEPDVTE